MAIRRSYLKSNREYTVSYSDMRGVDFSSNKTNIKRYRFSSLENMYKDYSGGSGAIESIPGFRKITSVYKKVHSIYSQKDSGGEEFVVFHAGNSLYRFALKDRDSLPLPSPMLTLKDTKSRGFTSGSDLYILDGENIARVRSDGAAALVGDETEAKPYVPTTYYNGEEYEQRNLLTDSFKEIYTITIAGDLAAESEGINYKILSPDEKTAAVTGISEGIGGVLHVPSYVDIGTERYKVTEIQDSAFYLNKTITALILSDTLTRIGKMAFMGCETIKEIMCRDSLEVIDNSAFLGCSSLSKVYIGSGIKKIGPSAFGACYSLSSIDFAGDKATFDAIDNQTNMVSISVNYGIKYEKVSLQIPIFSPAKSIESVTVDKKSTTYSTKTRDGLITAIVINSENKSSLDGKEVEILGKMDGTRFTKSSAGKNFLSEEGGAISGKAAILGCTVAESFDGRVFLSGNKNLPNTVFYSSRDLTGKNNPLYFGVLNYFNDGTGGFTVKSMLAVGDSLAVFKSGDDGGGSIYYHKAESTGIDILPRIYPVSYIHSGISALGESISFFDDPIFLSSLGCTALDKKVINLERSVTTRSGNVNARLLSENLSEASMARWCGYLVILTGEHAYLADSRQTYINDRGYTEYEWYYLSGLGAYRSASKVYKYSPFAKKGYTVYQSKIDCEVTGDVYLAMTEDKETVYFVEENGVRYEVYTEGEQRGGTFFPATCVAAFDGDILLFGATSGDICVFNNDKRGVAPDIISKKPDFDKDEYEKHFGRRIHPYFYAFDSHPPRYAVAYASDNGGIPNLEKSTVKHSLAVKLFNMGTGSVICEVGTEKKGYIEIARLSESTFNFAELDFSSVAFENSDFSTLALKEKERGWIEKSIAFYTDGFRSPFGICTVTYRFTVKGKIKN